MKITISANKYDFGSAQHFRSKVHNTANYRETIQCETIRTIFVTLRKEITAHLNSATVIVLLSKQVEVRLASLTSLPLTVEIGVHELHPDPSLPPPNRHRHLHRIARQCMLTTERQFNIVQTCFTTCVSFIGTFT
jgi:hypothetical protein